MYNTILVPTDGSEGAKAAARHGLNLANAFDSKVQFLSVVDDRAYSSSLAGIDSAANDQREALERQASNALQVLEGLVDETPSTYQTAIEHGVPHETIRSSADEHDVDLIAMGTHGRTGLDRYLIGSVAERVVRTSDVPVLTAQTKPEESSGYDRIVIPTDGSDTATVAVDHGLAIAEQYDATVHALSVVELSAVAGSYDVPSMIESLTERCERTVESVAEECENRGLDVVADVVEGTPYQAIQKYIRSEEIDLVAMGTHGRTGLGRYLIGSVTERIVRTSDIPVLTV
ncbi:universal stress protein [Halococcus thailandensis]|uniref:Universal stress protein UspA-like protein n=1 Tax=Halococcus thailandensis JCM 13552 TaxID=1227457 RepID=M0N6J5_9EURY|nr:universal stress protein [Halococcus thailandensis]EMA53527.1 universal stress protein UspA-like protein [Halococcus thailandensis JCM 13552]